MKTKGIFAVLMCSIGMRLSSQTDSSISIQSLNACEVNVLLGGYFQPMQYGSIAEFQKLAPGSELLKANFAGYNEYNTYYTTTNAMLAVNLGFRFGNSGRTAYKKNPLLRVGFSYFNTTDLVNSLTKTSTFRSDTLISATYGQVYYIDSTVYRTYNMRHTSDQVRLDISLIYRTDPKARWQFYGGFGLTAGASLKSYTNIDYIVGNNIQGTDYYFYPMYSSQVANYKNEFFRNSTDVGLSAYVPLGIDFRMGKKRPFWKRTHLFYEVRPGVSFVTIGDLSSFANVAIQQGLGIKVNWE